MYPNDPDNSLISSDITVWFQTGQSAKLTLNQLVLLPNGPQLVAEIPRGREVGAPRGGSEHLVGGAEDLGEGEGGGGGDGLENGEADVDIAAQRGVEIVGDVRANLPDALSALLVGEQTALGLAVGAVAHALQQPVEEKHQRVAPGLLLDEQHEALEERRQKRAVQQSRNERTDQAATAAAAAGRRRAATATRRAKTAAPGRE